MVRGLEDESYKARQDPLNAVDTIASSKIEPFEVRWSEAMTWWKSQRDIYQKMISRVAANKLIEAGAEEIGSSDLNHSVFSIYQNYKDQGKPELITFLLNYE